MGGGAGDGPGDAQDGDDRCEGTAGDEKHGGDGDKGDAGGEAGRGGALDGHDGRDRQGHRRRRPARSPHEGEHEGARRPPVAAGVCGEPAQGGDGQGGGERGPGVDLAERVQERGACQVHQGREGEDGSGHLGRLGDGRQGPVPERVAAGEEGGALDDDEGGGQGHRNGGGRQVGGEERGQGTDGHRRHGQEGKGEVVGLVGLTGENDRCEHRRCGRRRRRREAQLGQGAGAEGGEEGGGGDEQRRQPGCCGPDDRRPAGVSRSAGEEMDSGHISQQGGGGQRHRGRYRRDGGDTGGQDHDAGGPRPQEHDRASGQAEPAQGDHAGDPLGYEQLPPLQAGMGTDPGHVDRHQKGAEVEEHVAGGGQGPLQPAAAGQKGAGEGHDQTELGRVGQPVPLHGDEHRGTGEEQEGAGGGYPGGPGAASGMAVCGGGRGRQDVGHAPIVGLAAVRDHRSRPSPGHGGAQAHCAPAAGGDRRPPSWRP